MLGFSVLTIYTTNKNTSQGKSARILLDPEERSDIGVKYNFLVSRKIRKDFSADSDEYAKIVVENFSISYELE